MESSDLEPLALPLPIYQTVPLGAVTGKTGEKFKMLAGLDRELVAELKEKSLDGSDTEIQNNTSDRERFGEGSYAEWYSKDRTPFALVHESTGKLAAIAWFGPKLLGRKSLKHLSESERTQDEHAMQAGEWHTIVYRSYNPFRGQGLMKQFVRGAMDVYLKSFPKARIWAGIYADNPASEGLAKALGFVVDEERTDRSKNQLVMVLPTSHE